MKAKVLQGIGSLHTTGITNCVRKSLAAGESIPTHNHPNHQIYFIVTKGCFEITIAGNEQYTLHTGEVLTFNGENTIAATCPEASESIVVLCKISQ